MADNLESASDDLPDLEYIESHGSRWYRLWRFIRRKQAFFLIVGCAILIIAVKFIVQAMFDSVWANAVAQAAQCKANGGFNYVMGMSIPCDVTPDGAYGQSITSVVVAAIMTAFAVFYAFAKTQK